MEVGQPGTPAPRAVREAAARALEADRIGYTVALGIPELRGAIARHYGEAYGIALDPARVVVTTGSSAGFLLSFLSAFDAGDRVAMAFRDRQPEPHALTLNPARRAGRPMVGGSPAPPP